MLAFMDFGESGNDVSGLGDFRVDRRFVPDGFDESPLNHWPVKTGMVREFSSSLGNRDRFAADVPREPCRAFWPCSPHPNRGVRHRSCPLEPSRSRLSTFCLAVIGDAGGACPIWIRSRSLPVLDRVA